MSVLDGRGPLSFVAGNEVAVGEVDELVGDEVDAKRR